MKEELRTIQVLDKGFVRLVDYMGDDRRIVQAARVSYGQGTKTEAEDRALIQYLMRNAHTSPFEQVQFSFHCKMPVFVARQLVRHRTAKLNEISGRYSVMKEEFYVPEPGRFQKQSADNKQGSSIQLIGDPEEYVGGPAYAQESMVLEHCGAYRCYEEYLEMGMAKELARINLPLSLYTEWYWTIDLHNLFHFLRLRMDSHAQWEIQEYARAKYELIKPIVPWACAAFEEYVLNGIRLSATERDIVLQLLEDPAACQSLKSLAQEKLGERSTAYKEFMRKMRL